MGALKIIILGTSKIENQAIKIEEDSIKSVKQLIEKVEAKIKESSKENKKAWSAFLKECTNYLTRARKEFSQFISDARTALSMDDTILEMLNQWGENRNLAQTVISGNWEVWKMFAKNRQKKNPELKDRYKFVGEYYTSYSLGTKTVSKYLRQFVKKYQALYGAKFSIRADRDSINISFLELKESCKDMVKEIADEIKEEASKFNFDDSDGMTDYFHNFFYCFVQRGLYGTKFV
jgi:hypothetical protein